MSTIYLIWILIVIASLDVQKAESNRFCSFCDTTELPTCDGSNEECVRRTKCDKSTMQRCGRHDDLCLASWSYTSKGLTIISGCFPLPPHSKRTDYTKICKPWQKNGTFTCLCRRNGCNKYPSRPLVPISSLYQTTTSKAPLKGTMSMLPSVQKKHVDSLGHGKTWMTMATRLILIACTASIALLLFIFIYRFCIKKNSKDIQEKGSISIIESNEIRDVPKLPVLELVISKGKNSTVWRGQFNGENVAVKCFQPSEDSLWQNECSIYSKCRPGHKNILKFIAASNTSESPNQNWLATKFYEKGSLQDCLTAHTLTWEIMLTMAKTITAGLSYLHSEWLPDGRPKTAIAHQDLKSKNILVGEKGECILADFGLSIDLTQDYSTKVYRNGQVGTFRYMAPEKLEANIDVENPESFKQIDVYSLSLVLWELISRCCIIQTQENFDDICTDFLLPYEDLVGSNPTLERMTEVVVINGNRPPPPAGLTTHSKDDIKCLWTTIKECWDQDPDARLTAECVSTRLTALYQASSSEQKKFSPQLLTGL